MLPNFLLQLFRSPRTLTVDQSLLQHHFNFLAEIFRKHGQESIQTLAMSSLQILEMFTDLLAKFVRRPRTLSINQRLSQQPLNLRSQLFRQKTHELIQAMLSLFLHRSEVIPDFVPQLLGSLRELSIGSGLLQNGFHLPAKFLRQHRQETVQLVLMLLLQAGHVLPDLIAYFVRNLRTLSVGHGVANRVLNLCAEVFRQ
ncbi:AAEL002859-PA [Aedes aegypti]|uniref:AAEL002859-PA n=1 Tax=Aedes aegypti TaxID=7159 RepID=Q17GX5_AEDAE|nr:AAEL002859-PA [Aedes aegypti]